MIIDPESKAVVRREILKLIDQTTKGLIVGDFYGDNGQFSVAKYERERGTIVGLDMVLGLLEDKQPPSETNSGDNGDDESNT